MSTQIMKVSSNSLHKSTYITYKISSLSTAAMSDHEKIDDHDNVGNGVFNANGPLAEA